MTVNDTQNEIKNLTISVIMPVFNGVEFIKQSIPPLVEMLDNDEIVELMVVDDSSTDETIKLAKELGATVINSGGRLGPGGARNMAAKVAKGDLLWFVDADVIVHKDAASKILPNFESEQTVAIFGTYDDEPLAQNFLSQYKNLVHHYYHTIAKREASTFWSGCGVIRKREFIENGGFDIEKYKRPSIEDIELGYRLIKAGGNIILVKDFLSKHMKDWRFVNLIHTEIFCRAIPWSRLMIEQTGMVNDLNVGVMERLRAGVAGFVFISLIGTLFGLLPSITPIIMLIIAYLINKNLFKLLLKRKGPVFMIAGLLFHQIYYIYSSGAFVYCLIEHHIKKLLNR